MTRRRGKQAAEDDSNTIVFGGKSWTVRALDWETLEAIYPDLAGLHAMDRREQVRARRRVVIAALSSQAKEEDLRPLPTDLDEIFAASEKVAAISGYVRLGERIVAEAMQKASPSKAGTTSTPTPAPAPGGASAKSES
ncbi:MAG: hypothetical protein HY055_18090 [Magnetospirillum sp.]|nr:hypothetical protein [Magnetospirillum sp.]